VPCSRRDGFQLNSVPACLRVLGHNLIRFGLYSGGELFGDRNIAADAATG